jgi:murein hydrolase activator
MAVSCWVTGQNVDNLRSERESLLKEIESTTSLIISKKSSREAAFQQINALNKKISIRNRVIDNFKIEIEAFQKQIADNQAEIDNLEKEIQVGKDEYGRLLMDSYRRRNSLDELVYFLSSEGFSEAYQKYLLFQEYSRYRKKQLENLMESQRKLKFYIQEVEKQMALKAASLRGLESEFVMLNRNQDEKKKLVNELQKEEKWLRSTLKEKEKRAAELEKRIVEEINRAKSSSTVVVTGNDFNKFSGKLIWPVKKGIVVNRFGEHEHPVLKNVLVKNNGIDIQTTENLEVLSVHPGEVSRVITIPGYNNAVIMRHGTFLTVYANLKNIRVKQGQKIKGAFVIGEVFKETNDSGGILHFEIWNEGQKMDPLKWLLQ